ncbi:hypothetical protein [uncultured Streptomyces sp.]|uniref:hypothetical protein n=1 Tax=uncultured Streptomyces sp. TaxID=174707 RepID=UPI0026261D97|nr:hypothetical protein [uncultured Streptomyces sp.]
MTGHRKAARLAAGAAAVVLAAASATVARADDIGGLSAAQIVERSREALADAQSLRLRSTGDLGGGRDAMRVDLTLDREGNCAGGVDLGNGGGSVRIVERGDDVWLKPDEAFWENQVPGGGTAFEAVVAGRWMKGAATDPRLRTVTQACDLDTFRDRVRDGTDLGEDAGTLVKEPERRVDGVSVVPVSGTRDRERFTVYVSAEGTPYPVRVTVAGPSEDVTARLSDFDEPVPADTPAARDTVDITAVLGRTTSPV